MTRNQEVIAQTKKRAPNLLALIKRWIDHEGRK
jgi:hypothetical protein